MAISLFALPESSLLEKFLVAIEDSKFYFIFGQIHDFIRFNPLCAS